MQFATVNRIKMTKRLPYLIPFLFFLATSSKVFFDYNKIATYNEIGMDCRVTDPEKRSSIKIHKDNTEKVAMTTGCIMKSNDSRLSVSCIETEDFILLSINMTGYGSSDLGTWNCSDGNSYDTVTFQYFIQYAYFVQDQFNATYSCPVYKDCYLSLPLRNWHVYPDYLIQRIDGGVLPFIDYYAYPVLNYTFQDIKLSDAGIYYTLQFRYSPRAAFIIQVYDYPTQPVITAQTLSSISDQGLLELICSSESRTQPVFSRSRLSYHWKVNQLNTKDPYTCFRRKGPVLTLCPESCRLKANASISVTCTVDEDGLMSIESEPFIIRLVTPLVPVEQLVSTTQVSMSAEYKCNTTQVSVSAEYTGNTTQVSVSAEYTGNTTQVSVSAEYKDQTGGHSTGALIGACLGCLVAGSVLSIFLTLLFIRRSVLCKKESKGERNSGDRNEPIYINSVIENGVRITETETTRQYEVLDLNRMEYPKSQYTLILSKGSGHTNESEIYELA